MSRPRVVKPPTRANLGKLWEGMLNDLHHRYNARNEAVVITTPPPFKVTDAVNRGGTRMLVGYHESGPQDYLAVTDLGTLALEAKSTVTSSWGFAMLKEHQADLLDRFDARPGCSGWVLLHMSKAARSWAIPWVLLRTPWRRWHEGQKLRSALRGFGAKPPKAPSGTASLTPAGVDKLGGLPFDPHREGWLPVVLEYLRGERAAP